MDVILMNSYYHSKDTFCIGECLFGMGVMSSAPLVSMGVPIVSLH